MIYYKYPVNHIHSPVAQTITFDEPPKFGDRLKILFYRGTGGADVVDRDVIATVKVGDTLTLGLS